jgi:hypothetical protein
MNQLLEKLNSHYEAMPKSTSNLAAHNAAITTLLADVKDPALLAALHALCDQHESVLVKKQ